MMSFKLFVIFVVNIFQFSRVDIADLALVMCACLEMEFECFKIIEATIAKLAARMIEDDFSSLADISLLQMHLQLTI